MLKPLGVHRPMSHLPRSLPDFFFFNHRASCGISCITVMLWLINPFPMCNTVWEDLQRHCIWFMVMSYRECEARPSEPSEQASDLVTVFSRMHDVNKMDVHGEIAEKEVH